MGQIITFPMAKDNKVVPAKVSPAEVNENTIGTKYAATKDMDIKEVAKLIRADIKAAKKAGQLPEGDYKVKISRYSMGQSLYVTVSNVETHIWNVDRIFVEVQNPHANVNAPMYSEEGRDLLSKVEAIANAYNYDKSKVIEDYHDQKFFCFVNYESSWSNDIKKQIVERVKQAIL